jgi:hypothetical protein
MTPSSQSARKAGIILLICLAGGWAALGWWTPWPALILVAIILLLLGTSLGILDGHPIVFYVFLTLAVVMWVAYMIAHRIYPVISIRHF